MGNSLLSKSFPLILSLIILLASISPPVLGEVPRSLIAIDIPDYTVKKVDGWDYVDIPGGSTLLVVGKPRVPFYSVSVEYPVGYRVQSVTLKQKSEPIIATGLNLSTVIEVPLATTDGSQKNGSNTDWYPEKDFNWRVALDLDGSSTLIIDVFPFKYNPRTREARFYKHYEFKVTYVFSNVSIKELSTDKMFYDLGEEVRIDVLLNNSGEAKDIVVTSLVKLYGSDEIIDSLPLRTLHKVNGEASFSTFWNSEGFPPGYYYIDVMLNDTLGNWLDRRTCTFRLGRSMINVTSFSVEPQYFKIGDQVKISLEALNTGSTTLDGRCIFMIKSENGTIWDSYQNFSSLAPKASLKFTSTWNSSSAKKSALYYVIGYVSYESQTTPPMVIMISTNRLPMAKFSYTPTKVGLCEEVTFDASASSDPDGSISSYKWEFGDGGEASGVNVKHSYHGLGDYLVTLTVTDNEGARNSTTKLVRVVMMYALNVSSNIGVDIPGSGKYKEEDEVILIAPSSVNIPGLLGLLGARYVFKQWTGFMNSTNNSVKLVFTGYESRLDMRAVYSEDYTMMMVTLGIMSVVIIVVVTLSLHRRRGKKHPPPS
ncbi:MAG: PKD domain-containing protein [Thermoproteota archaeon]